MVTWGISRTMAALVTTASIAVVISGCATTQTDALSSSPAPVTPASTSSPFPPATPTPLATCETVLTDAQYEKFENDGLTFTGEATGVSASLQPYVHKGFSCRWGKPSTDILAWYAQWRSNAREWDSLRAELLDNGYIEILDPVAGIMESTYEGEFSPALTYRDGVIHYANAPWLFRSVRALQ